MSSQQHARLREAFMQGERRHKIEVAVVGILWLMGCPLLSFLPATRSGSLWGTPDEHLCGLYSYSASASMSGLIPKVYGSILAPVFAVLIVQRTSNGLCSILKLGWLSKYSPLVLDNAKNEIVPHALALQLWREIETIEYLGYVIGGFLIALVACDSKDFELLHVLFSTIAFMALLAQNYRIGSLGRKFPTIFPSWTSPYAFRLYYLGFFHNSMVFFYMFVFFGTIRHFGRCEVVLEFLGLWSERLLGNTETLRWLASVAVWYNEYAFGVILIYIQLLEHYERQLWGFVEEKSMPYAVILSRFSFVTVAERIFGQQQQQTAKADLFLGLEAPPSQEKRRKAKEN